MVVNATMPSRSPRVTISVSKWIIAAPSPSRRRGETDEPGLVRVVVVRIESARCARVRGAAAVPLPVERGLVIVEAPGREFPEPARPGLLDPDVLPPRGDPGREPPRVAPQAAVPAEERIVTAEREE